MLAQGDFLKLLYARSDERKEIFSRIFQTDVFAQIQRKLREKARALYGQIQDAKKSEEQEVSHIFYPDEGEYKERIREAVLPQDRQEILKEILKEGTGREKGILKEAKKMILENQYKISEIAEKVDIHDISYFIRVFKKIWGNTEQLWKILNIVGKK